LGGKIWSVERWKGIRRRRLEEEGDPDVWAHGVIVRERKRKARRVLGQRLGSAHDAKQGEGRVGRARDEKQTRARAAGLAGLGLRRGSERRPHAREQVGRDDGGLKTEKRKEFLFFFLFKYFKAFLNHFWILF
jgi:hypothetical protein